MKNLLSGNVSREEKVDISKEKALQYLSLLTGLPKKAFNDKLTKVLKTKDKLGEIFQSRDSNTFKKSSKKPNDTIIEEDEEESPSTPPSPPSPQVKFTKNMKKSFARIESVRESLPSYSRQVLLDVGEDIMQKSYLKDLQLHQKLTNM